MADFDILGGPEPSGWSARAVGIGIVAVVALVVLMGATATLQPFHGTALDRIGLSYGGGPFEDKDFQSIVPPGQSLRFNGWLDGWYTYPVTVRNYIISARPDEGDVEGADQVCAVAKDRVRVCLESTTRFALNTDPAVLPNFHEQHGMKYMAWTDDGWDDMLRQTIRKEIQNSFQTVARHYDSDVLYSDEHVFAAVQTTVGRTLQDRLQQAMAGTFFCGPEHVNDRAVCSDPVFSLNEISVPENVVESYNRLAEAKNDVKTAEQKVEQAKAEARAIAERQKACRDLLCVYLEAIKSGKVQFWVLPEGSNLTLPRPDQAQ